MIEHSPSIPKTLCPITSAAKKKEEKKDDQKEKEKWRDIPCL
jgi:hypothetical protein